MSSPIIERESFFFSHILVPLQVISPLRDMTVQFGETVKFTFVHNSSEMLGTQWSVCFVIQQRRLSSSLGFSIIKN